LCARSSKAGDFVDGVLGEKTAVALAEWGAIDGCRFEDVERMEWVYDSLVMGAKEANAGRQRW
jgi:hypothetical protein